MEKNLNAFIPNCLIWNGERTAPITFKQIVIGQCTRFNEYIKEKMESSIEEHFKSERVFIIPLLDYSYSKGLFSMMISYQREEEDEDEQVNEEAFYFSGAIKILLGEETMFNNLDEVMEDMKEILIKLIEKKLETGTNELDQKEIDKAYIEAMANKPYRYKMEYMY